MLDNNRVSPSPIDVHVGARVQKVRMFRNIDVIQLAGSLNINPEQLTRYEAGVERFPSECLLGVCKMLKTSPSFIFSGLFASPASADKISKDISTHLTNDDPFRGSEASVIH